MRVQFHGIGGALDVRPLQLKSVKLGAVNFAGFIAYRITFDCLNYFTIYTDYAHSSLYHVPNSLGRVSGAHQNGTRDLRGIAPVPAAGAATL